MAAIEPSIRNDRTREVRALVAQLAKELTDQVRTSVADLELTTTQAAVLRDLAQPRTQREIAGALRCEPSNVTYVVDRLEERGLVNRTPHPTDRRSKVIELTEAGWGLRTATIDRFESSSPLAALTEPELAEFERLLRKVTSRDASRAAVDSIE